MLFLWTELHKKSLFNVQWKFFLYIQKQHGRLSHFKCSFVQALTKLYINAAEKFKNESRVFQKTGT